MESILSMRTVLDHRISFFVHKDFGYSLICSLQSEEIIVCLIDTEAQFELNRKLKMAL